MANGKDNEKQNKEGLSASDVMTTQDIQEQKDEQSDPGSLDAGDVLEIPTREPSGRARRSSFTGDLTDYEATMTPEELAGASPREIFRNRAREQSTLGQAIKTGTNLLPNIALGLVENVGYLGELASYGMKELGDEEYKADFSNALTDFAKDSRNVFGEVYREDPTDTIDWDDPAWWMQQGGGLVESVGEFLVTGAGMGKVIGSGVGRIANVINNSMKASKAVTRGSQIATQGLTAAGLGYVEGAISAANVYDKVSKEYLNKNPEDLMDNEEYKRGYEKAKQNGASDFVAHRQGVNYVASGAAAKTAGTNTMMIGALNATSLYPLFKSTNLINRASKFGLTKGGNETSEQFLKRMDDFISKGGRTPKKGLYERFAVGIESGQESLEEISNLYAEKRGEQVGGVADTDKSGVDLWTDLAFSEEGALSGVLGALGGAMQTVGMRRVPFHRQAVEGEDGETEVQWLSAKQMQEMQEQETGVRYAKTLRDDIKRVDELQTQIQEAAEEGNTPKVEELKRRLFDVTARRSILLDGGQALKQSIDEIENIDNEQDLGELRSEEIQRLQTQLQEAQQRGDSQEVQQIEQEIEQLKQERNEVAGETEAMQLGLAESKQDNEYKKTAREKKKEVDELVKDFQDTIAKYNYGDEQALGLGEYVFDIKLRRRRAKEIIEKQQDIAQDLRSEIRDINETAEGERGTQLTQVQETYAKWKGADDALQNAQEELNNLNKNLDQLKRKYKQQDKKGVREAINDKIDNLKKERDRRGSEFVREYSQFQENEQLANQDPESLDTEEVAQAVEASSALQQNLRNLQTNIDEVREEYRVLNKRHERISSTEGRKEFVETAYKEFKEEKEAQQEKERQREAKEGRQETKEATERSKEQKEVQKKLQRAKTSQEIEQIMENNELTSEQRQWAESQRKQLLQQEQNVNIGDFAQWNSQGVDQFQEPKRVEDIAEDDQGNQFVKFEGEDTRVPLEQVSPVSEAEETTEQDTQTEDQVRAADALGGQTDTGPRQTPTETEEVVKEYGEGDSKVTIRATKNPDEGQEGYTVTIEHTDKEGRNKRVSDNSVKADSAEEAINKRREEYTEELGLERDINRLDRVKEERPDLVEGVERSIEHKRNLVESLEDSSPTIVETTLQEQVELPKAPPLEEATRQRIEDLSNIFKTPADEGLREDGNVTNTVDEQHELTEEYKKASQQKTDADIQSANIPFKAVGSNKLQYGPVREYLEKKLESGKIVRVDAEEKKSGDYFKLLESDRYDWPGTEITITPAVDYEGGYINSQGERVEGTFDEIYEEEGIYNTPVRITANIQGEEVDIGFLPQLNWVERRDAEGNYVNIAEKIDPESDNPYQNAEREINRIKRIREKVFNNWENGENTQSEVIHRSKGHVSLNYQTDSEGNLVTPNNQPKVELRNASEALPDRSLRFGIVRQGAVEFKKGNFVEDFDNDVSEYSNGAVVVQIGNLALPMWIDKVSEDQANTLMEAIVAKHTDNEEVVDTIDEITFNQDFDSYHFTSTSGLAKFAETITFSESFDASDLLNSQTPAEKVFFHVSEKNGHVKIGKAGEGIVYTTNPGLYNSDNEQYQSLIENQEAALELVRELPFSVRHRSSSNNVLLNNNESFTEITIQDGEVDSYTHANYNEYIKEHLSTYIDGTNTIEHGTEENPDQEYVYFEQPVIYFDDSFAQVEREQSEIVDQPTPEEQVEENNTRNIEESSEETPQEQEQDPFYRDPEERGQSIEDRIDTFTDDNVNYSPVIQRVEDFQKYQIKELPEGEGFVDAPFKKEKSLAERLTDYTIADFTAEQEQQVVDTMLYLVGEELHDGATPAQAFDSAREAFIGQYSREKDRGNDTIAGYHYNILDHWNQFEERAQDRLETIGYTIYDSETYETEDSNYEKTKFDDRARWLQDSKDTASAQLKMFLAFIPKQEYVGEGENKQLRNHTNFLGLPTYIPFDTVYDELSQVLADTEPTYENYINKLYKAGETNPHFANIADRLEEEGEDSTIPSEFVVDMSKQYINHQLALWNARYDKQGNLTGYDLKPISSDRSSATQLILDGWVENMKQSSIVTTNDEGQLVIDQERVKKLRDRWYDLNKKGFESPQDRRNKFKDLLSELGVKLDDRAMNVIQENAGKILGQPWGRSTNPYMNREGDINRSSFVHMMFENLLSNEDNPLFNTNSPLVNGDIVSRFRSMASVQYTFQPKVYSNSHTNVEGKTIYAYQMHNFLSHQARKLKNKEHRDSLRESSFIEDSIWLRDLDYNSDAIGLEYVDGLKRQGLDGDTIENLSKGDLDLMAASFFFGTVNQTRGREAKYISTTKADKTTTPLIRAPRKPVGISIEEGEVVALSGETKKHLKDLVMGEFKRILNFNHTYSQQFDDSNVDLDGYLEGANRFILFPYLNEEGIQQAVEDGIITEEESELVYKGEELVAKDNEDGTLSTMDVIMKVVEARTIQEINQTYEEWVDEGLIDPNANENADSSSFIDYGYLQNQTRFQDYEKKLKYAVADFTINNMISNVEQYRVMSGDPALFWNGDLEGTLDNMRKRLAKDIAPKSNNNWRKNERTFNKITLRDPEVGSRDANLPKEYMKGMEIADAQEFTTLREHLRVMRAWGKISPQKYDELVDKINDGEYYEFTEEEMDIILQPQKPVYVDNRFMNGSVEGLPDLDVVQHVYTKSSSFPLIPEFTSGKQIDELRKEMENNNVDRAAFKTADKVGAINPVTLFGSDGRTVSNNFSIDSENVQVLSREGFGLQQEVPVKEKSRIKVVTQMNKLLFSGMRDVSGFNFQGEEFSGRELEEQKAQIRKALFENSRQDLYNKLGIQLDDDGDFRFTDKEKLRNILKQEAKTRGWSQNDIEALEISEDGRDFIIPLSLSGSSRKIESLVLSMISSTVTDQEVRGKAYVQGTSAGLSQIQTEEDFNKNDQIVPTRNYDPERGLRFIEYNEETNENSPAQVFVPFDFTDNEGNSLNVEDFIDEEGYIDEERLPREARRMIGARIPNQGHSSMLPMEIAGFIPKKMGDLIIVPEEIVVQMGSDFDIDKLYTYQMEYNYKDGRIEPLSLPMDDANQLYNQLYDEEAEDSPNKDEFISRVRGDKENTYDVLPNRALQQLYTDIHWSVLTHGDAYNRITSPLDKPDLEREKRLIMDRKGTTKATPDSPAHYRTQRTDRMLQREGAQLIGVFALMNTFNSVVEDTEKADLRLRRIVKNQPDYFSVDFKTKNGNMLSLSTLSGKGTTRYNREERSKQENISTLLNIAVDNANLNVAGHINLNMDTAGVAGTMALLQTPDTPKKPGNALSLDYIARFLSQEAVERYVDEVRRLRSNMSQTFSSDPEAEALSNIRQQLIDEASESAGNRVNMPTDEKAFSNENLLDMIGKDNKTTDYYLDQLRILNTFETLKNIADEVRTIQQGVLNPGTDGTGTSVTQMFQNTQAVKDVKAGNDLIENTSDLLGEVDEDGFYQYQTEQGYAIENTIDLGNRIVEHLFPEIQKAKENIIEPARQFLTDDGILSSQEMQTVWEGTREYIYSHSKELGMGDLQQERDRLLFDREDSPSLAVRVRNAKQSWGSDNHFLQRIQTEISESPGSEPSYITFQAARGVRMDDIENARAMANMLVSTDQNKRKLAQDIAKYAYLTGGRQTAVSFVRYIPPQYLEHIGFAQTLHRLGFDGRSQVLDIDSGQAMKQIAQHNPRLAPNVEEFQMNKTEEEKGVITAFTMTDPEYAKERNQNLIKWVNNHGFIYPQYLRRRDTQNNRWRLYQKNGSTQDGQVMYTEIDTLGDSRTVEYNPYIDYATGEFATSMFEDNQAQTRRAKRKQPPKVNKEKQKDYENPASGENILYSYIGEAETQKESLINALRIIEDSQEGANAEIASFLRESVEKKDELYLSINEDIRGAAIYGENTIGFNPDAFSGASRDSAEKYILHEFAHAVTDDIIKAYMNNPESLTQEQRDIVKSLEMAYKKARRELTRGSEESFETFLDTLQDKEKKIKVKEGSRYEVWYHLSSLNEFVSGVMSSEAFQNKLNDIDFNGRQNIKDRILNLVSELLTAIANSLGVDVKSGTALESALTDIVELTETQPREPTSFDEQINLFSPYKSKELDPVVRDTLEQLDHRITRVKRGISNAKDKERKESYEDALERLQNDKAELLEKRSVEGMQNIIDDQLEWAKNIAEKQNADYAEISTALSIVDGWDKDLTMSFGKRLEKQPDVEGTFRNAFLNADREAGKIKQKLMNTAKGMLAEEINESLPPEERITSQDLSVMEDVGVLSQWFLDLSVIDNQLAQHLQGTISKAKRAAKSELKSWMRGLDEKAKLVDDNYEMLFQRDKNGNLTGRIIHEYSAKYDRLKNGVYAEYRRERARAQEMEEDKAQAKIKKAARKYYKWSRENEETIDIRFFLTRGFGDDRFSSRTEYMNYLIDEYGKERAYDMVHQAVAQYRQYQDKRDAYTTELEAEISTTDQQNLEDIENYDTVEEWKEAKIREWELENSPVRALQERFGIPGQPIDNYYNKGGSDFLIIEPRKTINGEPTGYYDERYENLSEEEKEFQQYYMGLIQEMMSYLPNYRTKTLPENFLPKVSEDFLESVQNNGIMAAIKKMNKNMIDGITTGKPAELENEQIREYEEVDPETGKLKKDIPIYLVDNEVDPNNMSRKLRDVTKLFAKMSLNFKYKASVEDHVNMAYRVLRDAKKDVTRGGRSLVDRFGRSISEEDGLDRLNVASEYIIESQMYEESRQEYTESNVKMFESWNPRENHRKRRRMKEIERQRDKIEEQFDANEISKEERDEKLEKLEKEYSGKIPANIPENATYKNQLENLKDKKDELSDKEYQSRKKKIQDKMTYLEGKNLVWGKVGEAILQFSQLKGMGFNVTAGMANIGFGLMSNFVWAAGNEEFTSTDMSKAFGIMLKNLGSSMKPGSENNKVANLVWLYDVLFEVDETKHGKSDGTRNHGKTFKKFQDVAYAIQHSTEYWVQGMSMVAQMLNRKIDVRNKNTGKIEEDVSLFDVYNEKGEWKEKYEKPKEWEEVTGAEVDNEFRRFQSQVIKTNKYLHGNYDPTSQPLVKKYLIGRMLMQFRSWVPYGFKQRFSQEYYDQELDRKFKGRYTTMMDQGIPGTMKSMFGQLIRSDEVAFGKKGSEERMSELDIANMKRNFREMNVLIGLMGFGIMATMALKEGTDEEEAAYWTGMLLMNQLYRVEQDIYFYTSPATFEDIAKSPLPVMRTYSDFKKAMTATQEYITTDDYEGNRLLKKWSNTLPFANQIPKTAYLAENSMRNMQ